MSRKKPAAVASGSARGRAIELPDWWLRALNEERGNMSGADIAAKLTELTDEEYSREKVNDFISGKVTTDRTLEAMLLLFPNLPPPRFEARSIEEARLYQTLARLHQKAKEAPEAPDETEEVTRVEETIESTGDRALPGKRRRGSPKK